MQCRWPNSVTPCLSARGPQLLGLPSAHPEARHWGQAGRGSGREMPRGSGPVLGVCLLSWAALGTLRGLWPPLLLRNPEGKCRFLEELYK